MDNTPLDIAFYISDNSKEIVKLLVIGFKANGSTFTMDTDLTVDEAKALCVNFVSWIDQSLGREMEKNKNE